MKDITWYRADGAEMNDRDWDADFARVFGVMLCGDSLHLRDTKGAPLRDDTFLLCFNSHHEDHPVRLPSDPDAEWTLLVDTAEESGFPPAPLVLCGDAEHVLPARSLLLFQQRRGGDDEARHPLAEKTSAPGDGGEPA